MFGTAHIIIYVCHLANNHGHSISFPVGYPNIGCTYRLKVIYIFIHGETFSVNILWLVFYTFVDFRTFNRTFSCCLMIYFTITIQYLGSFSVWNGLVIGDIYSRSETFGQVLGYTGFETFHIMALTGSDYGHLLICRLVGTDRHHGLVTHCHVGHWANNNIYHTVTCYRV